MPWACARWCWTWTPTAKRPRGCSDSFVGFVHYDGDDLVLQMPSIHQIERWPDAADLGQQVKGFLRRLRRISRIQAALA